MSKLALLFLSIFAFSCSDTAPVSEGKESRSLEQKPDYNYASLDGIGQKSKYVAGIDYDITMKTNSGIVVCRGNVVLFLRSSLALEFPDSVLHCGSARIDLTKILAGIGLHNPDVADDFKDQIEGNVLEEDTIDSSNGGEVISDESEVVSDFPETLNLFDEFEDKSL